VGYRLLQADQKAPENTDKENKEPHIEDIVLSLDYIPSV
jgi:hypothetical protein